MLNEGCQKDWPVLASTIAIHLELTLRPFDSLCQHLNIEGER